LSSGALAGQTIDGTAATFDGLTGASPTTLMQNYAIEDKITHVIDAPGLGFIRVKNANVFVTQHSENTTAGAIQRGTDAAVGGDRVNVRAGSFAGNLNVNKALTIAGGGSSTAGSVISAASG